MSIRSPRVRYVWLAALLLATACSDNGSQTADNTPGSSAIAQASPSSQTSAAKLAEDAGTIGGTDLSVLPTRAGPRRETTHGVPHIQLDVQRMPEVDAELRRRLFSLPGVEERESQLSLPGARSLWLADDLELARPEVLQAGREFAHIHPDGSLHVWLPVERAIEVAETKWGELHPWVGRDDFWDGLTMIYTPETLEEIDVMVRLVLDAYNYIVAT